MSDSNRLLSCSGRLFRFVCSLNTLLSNVQEEILVAGVRSAYFQGQTMQSKLFELPILHRVRFPTRLCGVRSVQQSGSSEVLFVGFWSTGRTRRTDDSLVCPGP